MKIHEMVEIGKEISRLEEENKINKNYSLNTLEAYQPFITKLYH